MSAAESAHEQTGFDEASFSMMPWLLSLFSRKRSEVEPAIRHRITARPLYSPSDEGEEAGAAEGRGREGPRRRGRGRFALRSLTGFAAPGRLGPALATAREQDSRAISSVGAAGGERRRAEGFPEAVQSQRGRLEGKKKQKCKDGSFVVVGVGVGVGVGVVGVVVFFLVTRFFSSTSSFKSSFSRQRSNRAHEVRHAFISPQSPSNRRMRPSSFRQRQRERKRARTFPPPAEEESNGTRH